EVGILIRYLNTLPSDQVNKLTTFMNALIRKRLLDCGQCSDEPSNKESLLSDLREAGLAVAEAHESAVSVQQELEKVLNSKIWEQLVANGYISPVKISEKIDVPQQLQLIKNSINSSVKSTARYPEQVFPRENDGPALLGRLFHACERAFQDSSAQEGTRLIDGASLFVKLDPATKMALIYVDLGGFFRGYLFKEGKLVQIHRKPGESVFQTLRPHLKDIQRIIGLGVKEFPDYMMIGLVLNSIDHEGD
ncbi:MAG: hypothetical protein UW75_C0027G0001, partial [Parcubacteria group bacterium GW2011_GWF2_44_8]